MIDNNTITALVLCVQCGIVGFLLGFIQDRDWTSLIDYSKDNKKEDNKDPHLTYLKARRRGK